jgi:hypothetical protein
MKRVRHGTMPRVKFYPKSKTVPLQAHQAWNILVSQVMTADRKPSKAPPGRVRPTSARKRKLPEVTTSSPRFKPSSTSTDSPTVTS